MDGRHAIVGLGASNLNVASLVVTNKGQQQFAGIPFQNDKPPAPPAWPSGTGLLNWFFSVIQL